MGAAIELGTAYVTITGSAASLTSQIRKSLQQSEKFASSTGRNIGKQLRKGIQDAQPEADIAGLQDKLIRNQEKLAAASQRAAQQRKKAADAVKLAEVQLQEVQESGTAKQSQILRAEQRLEAARAKYIETSRRGVSDITGYSKAVQESQRALDNARSATESAGQEMSRLGGFAQRGFGAVQSAARTSMNATVSAVQNAASTTKSVFSSIGSFAKNIFTGNFRGAFSPIIAQAKSAGSAVTTAFSNVWGGFTNGIANARSDITDFASDIKTKISQGASAAVSSFKSTMSAGFSSVKALASGDFKTAFQPLTDSAKRAGSAAKSFITGDLRSAAREAGGFAREAGSAFGSAFSSVKGKIKSAVSGGLDDASREARESGSESGSSFGNAFKTALAGVGIYAGLDSAKALFGSAITNAGNLEQSVGAVDAIFKESAGQMHAWAMQAKTSVGISEDEYNSLASVLGASLKNGGTAMDELGGKTNDLIKLGADLSSMFGGTTTEAIEAIGAALKGEMDPIEKYGISLNDAALTAEGLAMGIEKSGGAFTDQQKKLIVQSLLFKQSADAQGNFNRESDTFQHKQQVLAATWEDVSAKIGALFLPALSGALGFISDKGVPVLEEFVGGLTAFGSAWAAADGDVTSSGFPGMMEELAFTLRNVYDRFSSWGNIWAPFAQGLGIVVAGFLAFKGATYALGSALTFLTSPVTLIIAGLTLFVGALILAYNNVGWFRDMVNTAWAWIQTTTATFVDWWTTVAWPGIVAGLQAVGAWFTQLWQVYGVPAWNWIQMAATNFVTWFTTVAWPAITIAVQAIGQWFIMLWTNYIVPAWNGIIAAIQWAWGSIISPIFSAIMWTVQNVLAPIFVWLWQTIIVPVWNGIVSAVQWAWNTFILPIFNAIVATIRDILAPMFVWLWQNVIQQVWNSISAIIRWAWNDIIQPIFTALVWTLQNIVGPVFNWLWRNIVSPVFQGIRIAIEIAWDIIKVIFDAIYHVIKDVLGPVFKWLWDAIIKPVWDWISDHISQTWTWIKNNVFEPLGRYITGPFMDFWNQAKDGIGKVWDGLKEIVKKPIKFVVDTVINDGLIAGYNKLNDFWSGDDLQKIDLGFANGGWTGAGNKWDPAGIVHKDEFVITKYARNRLEKENPGALDSLNRTGSWRSASRGVAAGDDHDHNHGAASGRHYVHGSAASWVGGEVYTDGAPLSGTSSPIWGGLQQQMSAAGKLYVPKMNIAGVNTEDVARAWMGRSALNIVMGNGTPTVHFGYGTQGPWGFTQGNQITINPSSPSNMHLAILRHELGHVLSLHHTNNTGSIMHPSIAGVRVPSALDYGALVSAWGKPGEGVKHYDVGDDGGSDGSWLVDKAREFITDKIKDLGNKARDQFKGNGFVDMPIGIAEKMGTSVVNKAADFFGGSSSSGDSGSSGGGAEQWRGTIKQALEMNGLPTTDEYVNAWLKQVQTESGGNPRAVQNGYTDVNSGGNEAAGLLQVIPGTFAAYRSKELPDDRLNPLASAYAGINYAKSRYGASGMLSVIGKGHGYANGGRVEGFSSPFHGMFDTKLYDDGGLIHKGIQLTEHRSTLPDKVLTDKQWNAMYDTSKHVQEHGTSGQTINVTVPEREGIAPDTLGRRIGEGIGYEMRKAGIR